MNYFSEYKKFLQKILPIIECNNIDDFIFEVAMEKERFWENEYNIFKYITDGKKNYIYIAGSIAVERYDTRCVCDNILFDINKEITLTMGKELIVEIIKDQLKSAENIKYVPIRLVNNMTTEIMEIVQLLMISIVNNTINTKITEVGQFFSLPLLEKKNFINNINMLTFQFTKYEESKFTDNIGIEEEIDKQFFTTFELFCSVFELLEIKKNYKLEVDILHPPLLMALYDLKCGTNIFDETYKEINYGLLNKKLNRSYIFPELYKYYNLSSPEIIK